MSGRLVKAIDKLTTARRLSGTVIEVINGKATVKFSNNGKITGVRIVGGEPAIGQRVWVEWNGYEPVVNLPATTSVSTQAQSDRYTPADSIQTDPFTIGGWTVSEDGIISTGSTRIYPTGKIQLGTVDTGQLVVMSGQDPTYRMWAGHSDPANAPFSLTKLGEVFASSGEIAGWSLGPGKLYATARQYELDAQNEIFKIGQVGYNSGAGIWFGKRNSNYSMFIGAVDRHWMRFDGDTGKLDITGNFYPAGGIIDLFGTSSNSFKINDDAGDNNVDLVFVRTTGGNATIRWNGSVLSHDKPLQLGTGSGAPFTVAAGSQNQLVTGLNADRVDGYDLNQDVRTTATPSFVGLTVQGDVSVTSGGDLLVGSNVLAVNNTGARVGINRVADPQYSLDVAGNLRADVLVGRHAVQLPEALMIVHFDGTLMGHLGQQPYVSENVDYLNPGKYNQGIAVDSATNLAYYSVNNINESKGSLMFWVKPGAGQYYLIRHVNGTVDIELYYADGWILARRDNEQLAIEVTEGSWNHVTFTWDSAGEINLYANGNDARHPVCDWYVDSVKGNDNNAGTSENAPFQTIAKLLTVLAAKDVVGLACGSEWREKLTVPGNGCQIRMYGSGAKPVLRCDNVITNSNFSKTGGYTNVYQITVSEEYHVSHPRFSSMWVNGARLTWQSSIANVDANPGSYYVDSETSTTPTMYVHAPGSTDPRTDGKTYEYAARLYGLDSFASSYTIVHGVVCRRNLCNNGSAAFARFAEIAACEFNEGSKHNVYYGGGSLLLGVICSEAYYTSSATLYVYNENTGDGNNITHARCKAVCSSLFALGTGYHGHYNASTRFGTVCYADCEAHNVGVGITSNHATTLVINRMDVSNCTYGFQFSDTGEAIQISDPYYVETVSGRFDRLLNMPTAGVTVTITGGYVSAVKSVSHTGIFTILNTGCTLTVTGGRYELSSSTAAGVNVFYSTYATTITATYNKYKVAATYGLVYYLTNSSLVITTDYNQYDREATYNNLKGTAYATITQLKAAGYDPNSTVATLPALPTPTDDIAFYPADYDVDDLAITSAVIDAGLAAAIYESDAPVFAETSIAAWIIRPQTVWADEKGLWTIDQSGNAVLGVSAVNSKSWGGFTLDMGDIAFGRYGSSNGGWLLFDRSSGELSLGYASTQTIKFTPSGAEFAGVLGISTSGGIYQGTGSFSIPTTGLKIWNDSGIGRLATYKDGNAQVYFDTNGRLVAAQDKLLIDATGIRMLTGAYYDSRYAIVWRNATGSGDVFTVYGIDYTDMAEGHVNQVAVTGKHGYLEVTSNAPDDKSAYLVLSANAGLSDSLIPRIKITATASVQTIEMQRNVLIKTGMTVGSSSTVYSPDVTIQGGLWVGRTTEDPDTGELGYTGNLSIYRSTPATEFTGYVPVKLSTPWTKTLSAQSDVGTSTLLDISTFTNCPYTDTSWIKGYIIQIIANDSATWGTNGLYFACGPNSTNWYAIAARPKGGDVQEEAQGVVFSDNGDLYYQINASGAGTLDVNIYIWGILI